MPATRRLRMVFVLDCAPEAALGGRLSLLRCRLLHGELIGTG